MSKTKIILFLAIITIILTVKFSCNTDFTEEYVIYKHKVSSLIISEIRLTSEKADIPNAGYCENVTLYRISQKAGYNGKRRKFYFNRPNEGFEWGSQGGGSICPFKIKRETWYSVFSSDEGGGNRTYYYYIRKDGSLRVHHPVRF